MKSRTAPPPADDPRFVSVQVQIRMPWWRRRQLEEIASERGMSLPLLLNDALDRAFPPKAPS